MTAQRDSQVMTGLGEAARRDELQLSVSSCRLRDYISAKRPSALAVVPSTRFLCYGILLEALHSS
jgi:hypothetical protein